MLEEHLDDGLRQRAGWGLPLRHTAIGERRSRRRVAKLAPVAFSQLLSGPRSLARRPTGVERMVHSGVCREVTGQE